MFEDIEILHLDAPISTMFALAIVNLGLIVWLKHGFPREWRLAGWALLNVRRIWQRSADEAPRTGGVIIAHIQGVIALATISYACLNNVLQGFALGAIIVFVRLFTVQVLSRFKKLRLLIKESTDIDRHLRTWMAASVSVIAIFLSLRSQWNSDVGCNLLLSTWIFWSGFRLWRVFQTSIKRLSRYSFAFVYLCALEILPTVLIIRLVINSF
jgi:hypothetical protein